MKSREMAASVLSGAGLRPTRQRLLLAHVLFDRGDRHVTAEQLHAEAAADGATISLATVYNTLHQFQAIGLLREVIVESGRVYFDTNTTDHHHFYIEASGRLLDIPGDLVNIGTLPEIPEGFDLDRVDVVIRLREETDKLD
jgi:Fur family iron response transcriptional regulator